MREKVFLILFFIFVLIFLSAFYYFQVYLPKQKLIEYQKELEKVNKEIERLKKFDEEKYAEKVANILSFENFISTTTDIELEGVEIIPKGDRKLVINHAEGYQIEVPKELILNQTRDTSVLYFDDLGRYEIGMPRSWWHVYSIYIFDNPEFIKRKQERIKNAEKILTNSGLEFYKYKEHVESEFYGLSTEAVNYVTFFDNKVLTIQITGGIPGYKFQQLEDFVKTFRFIEKNE
ncbi:MAG: hypothetical protein ACO2OW_01885 [Minisyncoccia bacterium]|jgi:hypothetical protein